MGFWSKTFTWWNGATWGTVAVPRRTASEVGRDDARQHLLPAQKDPRRRWVIYDGDNDGSNVPPGWNAWLRGTIDELPDKALPPRRGFHQPPEKNLTGTMAAFRPDGSLGSGRSAPHRPAITSPGRPTERARTLGILVVLALRRRWLHRGDKPQQAGRQSAAAKVAAGSGRARPA